MKLNFDSKYKYAKPRKGNGGKCFILGTAPSLEDEDLSLLNGWPVFCCNKAWLAQKMLNLDKCNWIVYTGLASWSADLPDMIDYGPNGIPMISDLIYDTNDFSKYYEKYPHDFYVFPKRGENDNISKRISSGYIPTEMSDGWGKAKSVVLDAIIIAYLMGFTDIYLLGVDLDYTSHRFYFYEAGQFHLRANRPTTRDKTYVTLCTLAKGLSEKGVKLTNLSKGFKQILHGGEHMPTGTLADVVGGIYRHKTRGLICGDFYPLTENHINILRYARQGCDIVHAGVYKQEAVKVVEAIRGVDKVIKCENLENGILSVLEEYPQDKVRVFYNQNDNKVEEVIDGLNDDRVKGYPTDPENHDYYVNVDTRLQRERSFKG
jgi:hypothetical protein